MTTTDTKRRQARSGAAVRSALDGAKVHVVMEIGGWQLAISDVLDHGMVFSRIDQQRVVISQETWDTLRSEAASTRAFFARFLTSDGVASGLSRLDGVEWWNDAIRAEAVGDGSDLIQAKDQFTQLEEEMNALIVAASGLADGSTGRVHMEAFFIRLVNARSGLEQAEARVNQLSGILGLAEQVVAALR